MEITHECADCGGPNAYWEREVREKNPTDRGEEIREFTEYFCLDCYVEIVRKRSE